MELPSFLTFNLFCRFMRNQFERTMNFALLQPKLSRAMGLSQLRHYFCEMLVSTSSDFSLRQVPRFKTLDEIKYTLQETTVLQEIKDISPKHSAVAAPSLRADGDVDMDDADG